MAKHGSVLATAPVGGAARVAGPSTPGAGAQTRTPPPRGAEWWLDRRNVIIKPRKIKWVGVGSPKGQLYRKRPARTHGGSPLPDTGWRPAAPSAPW